MAANLLSDDMLLQRLAARVQAASMNPVTTPISKFSRNYGPVLARASAGQLQVISRKGEQFFLLSMAQVRNLMPPEDNRTMAKLFAGLPSMSGLALRVQTPANAATAADQYRLPPGLKK